MMVYHPRVSRQCGQRDSDGRKHSRKQRDAMPSDLWTNAIGDRRTLKRAGMDWSMGVFPACIRRHRPNRRLHVALPWEGCLSLTVMGEDYWGAIWQVPRPTMVVYDTSPMDPYAYFDCFPFRGAPLQICSFERLQRPSSFPLGSSQILLSVTDDKATNTLSLRYVPQTMYIP